MMTITIKASVNDGVGFLRFYSGNDLENYHGMLHAKYGSDEWSQIIKLLASGASMCHTFGASPQYIFDIPEELGQQPINYEI